MKTFSTFKLSLTMQAISIYLIASGYLGWYLYVLLALIMIERIFIDLVLYMAAQMQKEGAKQLTTMLEQDRAQAPPFGVDE